LEPAWSLSATWIGARTRIRTGTEPLKKTLADIDRATLRGRTVLVRTDLNVRIESGRVLDVQRIEASMPTLTTLHEAGARTVVLSHMGRPQGRPSPDLSLASVAAYLGDRLGRPVLFVRDAVGQGGENAIFALGDGEIALLENTRFHPGETVNDPELAATWSGLTDLFVNDAFGAAHRAHASTVGLARAVTARGGDAVAGLLMARELEFLGEALESPERPFVAILGGAKISGKIDVVEALLPRVDRLLIGGAMANTFFRAMQLATGESLVEENRIDMAGELIEAAGDKLTLPVDCVVARDISPDAQTRVVARAEVGDMDRIVDIGPETRALYRSIVSSARTVVWNGPMGVFEIPAFAAGTVEVARAVADACDAGALGVLGGGQTASAAAQAGVVERLSHVSTGGGASLALLAGAALPGVESLSDREYDGWL